MNCVRVKETFVALVFVCLVGCIFVSGCSMNNKKEAAMPLGKTLVIDLTDAPEYQPLLTGTPQTCGMRSGRVYLKPGEECGQHSTKAHEETLVFLSGKGTALIGKKGEAFGVGSGKICYIPPNTLHNIKNTGSEPLIYIYCVAPINTTLKNHEEGHEHQH
jgi:mannose-6-phosphate isomerase-like protein (cupin superfamily)